MNIVRAAVIVTTFLTLSIARLAAAADPLPALIKPGLRVTWDAGDSIVHGVTQTMKPDPEGNWVDPKTGQRYTPQDTKNSGGVGYTQFDFVHAAPELVVADIRNYQLSDPANRISSLQGSTALIGNGDELGEYWINPARIARMVDGRAADGTEVSHVKYAIRGKQYDAISLVRQSANQYLSLIYEVQTGLLLSRSSCVVGDAVSSAYRGTPGGAGRGAAQISHSRLITWREVKAPWAADPAPEWAKQGMQLDYQGSYRAITQAGALPGLGTSFSYTADKAAGNCVFGNARTRSDIGPGLPPQESTGPRAYGSSLLVNVWIAPASIQKLKPGQVIDEDPVTRYRLTFSGVQGNGAIFTEQGPVEQTTLTYDMNNGGVLSAIQKTQAVANFGQQQTQLQLVGRR